MFPAKLFPLARSERNTNTKDKRSRKRKKQRQTNQTKKEPRRTDKQSLGTPPSDRGILCTLSESKDHHGQSTVDPATPKSVPGQLKKATTWPRG